MSEIEECIFYWDDGGGIREHYFIKDGYRHGEYKSWHINKELFVHRYYKDGWPHGEYKSWNSDGMLSSHSFWRKSFFATTDVEEIVRDILNITDEEKVIIKLKFDIDQYL